MSGKRVAREAALAARAAMSGPLRAVADARVLDHVRDLIRDLVPQPRVAAHVPMSGEPGGPGLPDALVATGAEVLLPVLLPDNDLDWGRYGGELQRGAHLTRLHEPIGPRLGLAALTSVDLVLVPALAVDPSGIRLGRGGGSYDRALARVPPGVPIIALLYDGEMVPALPAEPHDRPVSAVITPAGRTTMAVGP
jgi:5-formyltetrahydrofolate cyclo-ligase